MANNAVQIKDNLYSFGIWLVLQCLSPYSNHTTSEKYKMGTTYCARLVNAASNDIPTIA